MNRSESCRLIRVDNSPALYNWLLNYSSGDSYLRRKDSPTEIFAPCKAVMLTEIECKSWMIHLIHHSSIYMQSIFSRTARFIGKNPTHRIKQLASTQNSFNLNFEIASYRPRQLCQSKTLQQEPDITIQNMVESVL